MDRMKITLILFLFFWGSASGVSADEGAYWPTYVTSPSAAIAPTPTPTPSLTPVTNMSQPEITCTLKITLPTNTSAPMEASFDVRGTINGSPAPVFRYVFGDGESATGSGVMKHTYYQSGTYQARVTPVVAGAATTPICKGTITVTAPIATATPVPTPTPTPTPSPTEIASSASTVSVQPKTGPGSWYWMSLVSLVVVWLGALTWYRKQHPQIG